MRRQIALVFAVALILVAGSAAAEIFTVTLHNGNTFETRYQPQEASWDPSWVLLMTENGNQIALAKDEIATVQADTENKGFGFVIDNTTIALGWAPNDAEAPGEGGAVADQMSQLRAALEQRSQAPQINYQQFIEPDQLQGIPVGWIGTTTPPLSAGEPPQQ